MKESKNPNIPDGPVFRQQVTDDFSNYDDWLELAMACHSATGGAGLWVFIEWSKGGAKFTSESRVEEQWHSFDAKADGGVTVNTLFMHIRNAVEDADEETKARGQQAISKAKIWPLLDELPELTEQEIADGAKGREYRLNRQQQWEPEADDELDQEGEEEHEIPKFALPESNLSLAARLRLGIPEHTYYIQGVLVADELMALAAPHKCLKTSIALDMAISLATATPFLGFFRVPKKRRVKFISVESGERTLLQKAARVLKSKDLEYEDAADLSLCFDIVQCGNSRHLVELKKLLIGENTEVLIVDPAYLTLLAGLDRQVNSGSVFEMGEQIRRLNDVCKAAGTTPVLLHHTRKNDRHSRCEPTELEDLSGAGFREYARQWVLPSRRTRFAYDGVNELRLDIGGSAGHNGCYAVDIDEGHRPEPVGRFDRPVDPDDELDEDILGGDDQSEDTDANRSESEELCDSAADWRIWRAAVTPFQKFVAAERQQKSDDKAAELEEKVERVIEFLDRHPDGETRNQIGIHTAIGNRVLQRIVDQLVEDGRLVETKLKKSCGQPNGYRLNVDE